MTSDVKFAHFSELYTQNWGPLPVEASNEAGMEIWFKFVRFVPESCIDDLVDAVIASWGDRMGKPRLSAFKRTWHPMREERRREREQNQPPNEVCDLCTDGYIQVVASYEGRGRYVIGALDGRLAWLAVGCKCSKGRRRSGFTEAQRIEAHEWLLRARAEADAVEGLTVVEVGYRHIRSVRDRTFRAGLRETWSDDRIDAAFLDAEKRLRRQWVKQVGESHANLNPDEFTPGRHALEKAVRRESMEAKTP